MKILLLTPPAMRLMNPATLEPDLLPVKSWVPLGIASLAAALRAGGFEADLRDLHSADWDAVNDLLAASKADVVGISCFTFERVNALRTAALVRQALPSAVVVMGGPHATCFPGQILSHGVVDIVVLGEGEETMVALAACLARNGNLQDVEGIAFRRNNGLQTTRPRVRSDDLDALAFPVYDAFDLTQYKSPEIPDQYRELIGTHVITSRGCPYACHFCSVHHFFEGRWAFRSPGNVADELERLVREQGVRHVYFSDDLFTLNPQRTIGICREILERRLDIVWMAETRVDCVTEEMLRWMRKAGCYRIYFGVESGSPRILKAINKRFTVAQVAQAFDLAHKVGMEPCCFLMVGNPGETPGTIAETIALIKDIRPATMPIIGITTILPGTQIYERAKDQGLLSDDFWLTDSPPPLYTGEHDLDDLIALQLQLTLGVCPEMFEHLCAMGFDESFFQLRRMRDRWSGDALARRPSSLTRHPRPFPEWSQGKA